MKYIILRLLFLAGALASAPHGALAHAIVVKAVPQPGVVIMGPDLEIAFTFNVRIDTERSTLTLTIPDGSVVAVKLDRNAAPGILAAHLSGLAPGMYSLRWQVLATDGHITRGDVPFTVAAQ